MNQQEHVSQLSALFDNELSPDHGVVIRREGPGNGTAGEGMH
jgi:hypothetical protein